MKPGKRAGGLAASCDSKLNVPKVALMFLARGNMPLTKVWEAWLQPMAGLVPAKVCQPCRPGKIACTQACVV